MSKSRPRSSEWYCKECHKSYPMTGEEIQVMMNYAEQAAMGQQ